MSLNKPLPPRWRVHSPRTDAVDPDPVSHEVTGQGLGHANHGGLGGAVGEAGGQAAHRGAHRGHVDDVLNCPLSKSFQARGS